MTAALATWTLVGLAEAVADGHAPGLARLLDELRVQRFAGPDDFTGGVSSEAEIGLDDHPATLLAARRSW
ncbi:hypothetical protein E1161_15955 [Saccharopolyspora aridisoli]|uniref:Uncharacterized protein n=1 Tax=Saccharopolyspora aridisoli TaxID=2530385 RepID=A0A4R4UIH8_9PSEU|nr:hypothetical protein [Saccharopolyspora aridisoli]TDC91707.1 hypothetical protein E1161_15955 [Saccharopolyspora aridisoli]